MRSTTSNQFVLSLWLSLGLLTAALAPAQASAANIDIGTVSRGQVTVTGHGFSGSRSSYQVNFYVNAGFLGNSSTSSGSFSYMTPQGRVKSNDTLTVKVLEFLGSGRHYERSFTVSGSADPRPTYAPDPRPTHVDPRPTHVPDPRPTHVDPRPTHTPDPRPTSEPISHQALYNYANQQARTVANRVAATYGALENWRYNFVDGFWQGYAEHSGSSAGADYQNGYSQGISQGQGRGYDAGRAAALERAETLAPADAKSRYLAVVDQQGADPDLQIHVPPLTFEGSAPHLSNPSLDAKLNELNILLQQEARSLTFRSDAYILYWNSLSLSWSLRDVFQYGGRGRYTFVDSWFRGDFAYEEWRGNRLGGGYDYHLYSRFESAQKEEFIRYFKQIYNQVIDVKFLRERNQHNAEASSRGYWYGQRAGADMARQAGYNAGYSRSYLDSSRQGFLASFNDAYAQAFGRRSNFYATHPALEVQEIRLTGEHGTGGILIAGEKLGIQVLRAVNIGRRPVDVPVSIEADGRAMRPLPSSGNLTLGMSSSLKEKTNFTNLGEIASDVETDQTHQVTVLIGNERQSLTFSVRFEAVLRGYAAADMRGDLAQRLGQYLVTELRKEWKACLAGSGNCYSRDIAEKRNIKLYQLVRFYQTASGAEKSNILAITGTIRKITDDDSFWHPFVSRAFQNLLSEIR